MRPADRLAEFTRAALAAGHSRAEAAAALRAAGWAESEISAALDAWADTPFRPPVPRPGRSVSAAEAFSYGLTFVALALVAGHLTALWFALIGRALPLPGEMPWYSSGTIRWSLAVLAVSFPLFLWLDLRAARAGAADPAQRRSAVRGWFAHAALFLAVLGLAGDLVAVLYAFLSGELTLRFAAKAAVVAALAGTVFLYFRPLRAAAAAPPLRPAVWMLASLVLPAMALGLWAVGGPARGQAEARDRIRMEDIATLFTHVECRANEAGGLPAALDGTDSCPLPARTADPFTGAAYGYARVSDVAFRLCAAFETDQTDRLPWQASGFDPATGCLTLRHDLPEARP